MSGRSAIEKLLQTHPANKQLVPPMEGLCQIIPNSGMKGLKVYGDASLLSKEDSKVRQILQWATKQGMAITVYKEGKPAPCCDAVQLFIVNNCDVCSNGMEGNGSVVLTEYLANGVHVMLEGFLKYVKKQKPNALRVYNYVGWQFCVLKEGACRWMP